MNFKPLAILLSNGLNRKAISDNYCASWGGVSQPISYNSSSLEFNTVLGIGGSNTLGLILSSDSSVSSGDYTMTQDISCSESSVSFSYNTYGIIATASFTASVDASLGSIGCVYVSNSGFAAQGIFLCSKDVLDEPFELKAGKSYALSWQLAFANNFVTTEVS